MLTKDLLLHRTRSGRIRPQMIDVKSSALLQLATELVKISSAGVGERRKELDEALKARAAGFEKPKISKGLVKLLQDRMEFEEPGEDAALLRERMFERSSAALVSLPEGADFQAYEKALSDRLEKGQTLGAVREQLHADLAEYRKLLSFKKITPAGLLERYNLSQAQGLLIYADSVHLVLRAPQLLEVRRLLRWLKFCRLVAQLTRKKNDWVLEVEGPGAILSMQKKYGLQLAQFFSAVPQLSRFELTAQVTLPRRSTATLKLSEEEGLVSPLHAGGYVPEEIEIFTQKFEQEEWRVDLVPEIRHVGASGVAVPDLLLHHDKKGLTVAIELFHQWHRGMLQRRLTELSQRPDPHLYLGVDRALSKDETLASQLEGHAQVFLFNAFPSERAVKKILKSYATKDDPK